MIDVSWPTTKPSAVTTPIVSSPTVGNSSRGCSRAKDRKKTPSRAASYGTREPASRPANTDVNAVTRMKTVTILAAVAPHERSSTTETTEVYAGDDWFSISCQSTTPRTPTCIARYTTIIASTAMMIDRGSVRPGLRISAPR